MITRQVREVKNIEDEIRQMKRQLDNFDRYASTGNLVATPPLGGATSLLHQAVSTSAGSAGNSPLANSRTDLSMFDKDFECSVCLEEMRPPVKIFQCRNGHVMCESCKNHPEVSSCPTCRIPLPGPTSLMRNIPMEKLARSYFERMDSLERQYLASATSAIAALAAGGRRSSSKASSKTSSPRGRSPGPPRTRRESSSGSDLMNLNPTRTQPQSCDLQEADIIDWQS